jgi:hypothetical protein
MPFESVVSLPSRACLYPCRPSFHTPHSGRCHALDMINCRRYDGWRAENLGIKRMTDEAPVRLWCRVHAHVHAVRLSIMHVNQTLRIAAMPVTPATVVATAVSFVVALGGRSARCRVGVSCSRTPPFPTLHSIACSVRAGRGEKLHVSQAKTCHRSKQREIWHLETTGHAASRFL